MILLAAIGKVHEFIYFLRIDTTNEIKYVQDLEFGYILGEGPVLIEDK